MPEEPFAGVQVLHKALDVLEALRGGQDGVSLAELSARVAMPKPTVYRIVATFESRGYIDRSGGGACRLSRKLLELHGEGFSEQSIIEAARPAMAELVRTCKETVNLGVLDAGEVVVIETMESPQAVRMSSKIGNRRYPHSTALGKVLLAGMPDKDVERHLRAKGMPAFTQNTLTTEEALLTELNKVRAQGYALDNRENEEDGRCVAAPIIGPGKRVVASISISGPLPRMTVTRAKSLARNLCLVCKEVGQRLSHQ